MEDTSPQQGLYKSEFEHDSCGIGFVANIKGKKSHDIVRRGIEVLERMEHRGAESADNKTGDGSGILLQIPHAYYSEMIESLPGRGRIRHRPRFPSAGRGRSRLLHQRI